MSDKKGSGKVLFNPFDVVEDASLTLNDLSPELRMTFKKLQKKEPNSRIKGLEELASWISSAACKENEFLLVLSQFVKVYESSVIVPERQIRELANVALLAVIKREKKWLSPVVKELLFPWLGSMMDPVNSVACLAQRAFLICFGDAKNAEIAKIAFANVISKAECVLFEYKITEKTTEARFARNLEISHTINAVNFIATNSSLENLKVLKESRIISDLPTIIKNPESDLGCRSACYKLIIALKERSLLVESDISILFSELCTDLPTFSTSTVISLLNQITFDESQSQRLIQTISKSLATDFPSNSIPSLFLLRRSNGGDSTFFNEDLLSIVWKVLENYKSLDTLRFLIIWKLFTDLLNVLGDVNCTLEFIRKAMIQSLNSNILPNSIRKEGWESLYKVSPSGFHDCIDEFMSRDNIFAEVKLNVFFNLPYQESTNSITLSHISSLLPILSWEKRKEYACKFIENSIIIEDFWPNFIIEISLQGNNDFLIEFVKKLLSCHSHLCQSIFQLMKAKLSPELRLIVSVLLIKSKDTSLSKILLDKEVALLSCESLEKEHLLVLISFISSECKLNTSSLQEAILNTESIPVEVEELAFFAQKSILESKFEYAKVFIIGLCIYMNLPSCVQITEEIVKLIVESNLPTPTRNHIISKILRQTPDIWESISNILYGGEMDTICNSLLRHINTSIALYSYPILKCNTVIQTAKDFPEIGILPLVLENALEDSKEDYYEIILVLTCYYFCIEEESKYHQCNTLFGGKELLNSLSKKVRREDLDTFLVIEGTSTSKLLSCLKHLIKTHGGMFWYLAKVLGAEITIEFLLNHECPLQASILNIKSSEALEIPDEPSKDQIMKLLLADIELSKDKLFQLLANFNECDFIKVDDSENVFVLVTFLARHLGRSDIKPEYWTNHKVLIKDILSRAFFLALVSKESRYEHHFILSKVFTICTLDHADHVKSNSSCIWDIFCSSHKDKVCPATKSLYVQLSKVVTFLSSSYDKTVSREEVLEILFNTEIIPYKMTCRNIVNRSIDDVLERARVTLSKKANSTMEDLKLFEEVKEQLLVPWQELKQVLQDDSIMMINRLFGLDIFLCLAEGSKDDSSLASAYGNYFKDNLATLFLPLLVNILGWEADEAVDLSRVEFVILGMEYGSTSEPIPYAANLLFRIIKSFPSAVRSWHSSLKSKEENLRIIKAAEDFMCPLLIERELQRIRKGSRDALQMRVEQTSTKCSIQVQYIVEEFSFSLTFVIPPSYPFKPVTVTGGERLGISETKWRSWLLSVQTLLSHNLAIIEVIQQWKQNAEKTLEGVEPCSICYCVLQPGDRSLPGPCCKTCKNKFHSTCLYKWFKTGGTATCPMCRSLF